MDIHENGNGSIDSRKLPSPQPAAEIAELIAGVIEHQRAELYSTPLLRDFAARYLSADDVGAIEAQPPFNFPGSRR